MSRDRETICSKLISNHNVVKKTSPKYKIDDDVK